MSGKELRRRLIGRLNRPLIEPTRVEAVDIILAEIEAAGCVILERNRVERIAFPDLGDTYESAKGDTYTWDGYGWVADQSGID